MGFEATKRDADPQKIIALSAQYQQKWNQLVSTTNWEKGSIICQWRESLRTAGFSAHQYSDESWSRQVGNVTPQHTGRLRKVHSRFGGVSKEYPGLYWSHFLAALDWEDPELWLEGARQNRWSVSQMRKTRATAIDEVPAGPTQNDDILLKNLSENLVIPVASPGRSASALDPKTNINSKSTVLPPDPVESRQHNPTTLLVPVASASKHPTTAEKWPKDLQNSFNRLEQILLKHKALGWPAVEVKSVLAALDKLKILVKSRI